MSRCVVRTGSIAALLLAAVASLTPALGAQSLTYRFGGQRISFTQLRSQPNGRAVAIDDAGLRALLASLGATVTWRDGERYVLITTAEPTVIGFAIGDRQYDVGPIAMTAPFAPFVDGGHAYVPLDQLLAALDLAARSEGSETVLQPQLASLDVASTPSGAKLVAHAGVPLDGRIVSQDAGELTIEFDGVGSALPPMRSVQTGPVTQIDSRTEGSASSPRTLLTLHLAPDAPRAAIGTDDQRDFTIAFGASSLPAVAARPQPSPSTQGVEVTAVDLNAQAGGAAIHIALSATAAYEWHRLRPPDNRWWIDVQGARLAVAEQSRPGSGPVLGVRVRQQSPQIVRVALSLSNYDAVTVSTDSSGITVSVADSLAQADAPRSGPGNPSVPFAPPSQNDYAAPNPRLIVIDPGHGGSDTGAVRGAAVEKVLTLDMAKRLRAILTARGWRVVMTRDTDRDVYAADDSAHDELQARDDIANSRGARLLISIHVNSFMNAGPHGATVYYYKAIDLPLAQALDRRMAQLASVKDDGIVKDKLYVVHHAHMPAALVETAYLSNPDDVQLLLSSDWRQKMAIAIADGIEDYAGVAPANTAGGQ